MEKNNFKNSFSIIETLIVVTIISILFAFGITNYQNFNQQQKLKSEAKKFIDVFELTKKKAISSQLEDQTCTNFNGYELRINSSGNQYQNFFGCSSNYSLIQTYILPTNIIFTVGTNSNFNFPSMGTNLNINTNLLRLKNTIINQCIDITISPNGIIEILNTLISC
ncbi:MAG: hypothetical protein Fur009_3740 [Candidatus Microgenomates bacterium]